MQFEINDARVKSLAWSMKNYLQSKGHEVPNTAILEALSQGLGFSDYRTLKTMADAPSEHVKRAREWMKGDTQVAVYFGTYYDTMLMAPDYPDWGKLVLTEQSLADIFEMQAQVEKSGLGEVTSPKFQMHWADEREHRLQHARVVVDCSSVWLTVQLRHEDGAVNTRPWYFDDLDATLKTRKAGEAVFVELEDTEDVEASDPASPRYKAQGNCRYVVADSWGHCFVGSKETMVSFVFDRQVNRIVHMRVSGHVAHRDEMADVEDSLLNANEEALDDPESCGLEETNELPDWALADAEVAVKAAQRVQASQPATKAAAAPEENVLKLLEKQVAALGYTFSDVADWVFETYDADIEGYVEAQIVVWVKEFIARKS